MDNDAIRVAVISDTHGLLRRSVIREVQDCSCILHAGDIIRESDLDELALYGSLYTVRGNNDLWQQGLRDLAGILLGFPVAFYTLYRQLKNNEVV